MRYARDQLRARGLEVGRSSGTLPWRRSQLLAEGIGLVVDVGANVGQYAGGLRRESFDGDILSIEPLRSAYALLRDAAEKDPRWHVANAALGSEPGVAVLNVSGNSVSSSLLPMLGSHLAAAPDSKYVRTEQVAIKSLTDLFKGAGLEVAPMLLKVDTQGTELDVLSGIAPDCMGKVQALELELSLSPLYGGQALAPEVLSSVYERGFELIALEPVFATPSTNNLLQVNGLFQRVRELAGTTGPMSSVRSRS